MSNPALLLILGAAGGAAAARLGAPGADGGAAARGPGRAVAAARGHRHTFELFGLELNPVRVDALSRVFATGFLVAALLTAVYALHLRDSLQQAVILVYAGAAVGGSLAGDLLTLFVFWELAGLSSVVPDLGAAAPSAATAPGMRYLVAQVISGLLMLAGIALRVAGRRRAGVRLHRAGRPGRRADPGRGRHQVRLPGAARVADRHLSGGDHRRCGGAVGVHDQVRGLRPRPRLRRHRAAGVGRRGHDRASRSSTR